MRGPSDEVNKLTTKSVYFTNRKDGIQFSGNGIDGSLHTIAKRTRTKKMDRWI
jgi:hypothetical protein